MDTREWTTVDKAKWGPGPWMSEPDKRQWPDEATGLPCLMVRNPGGGNWCGYVGVPATHPLHGKHYDANGVDVRVHGGLTFSEACTPHTPETWAKFRERMKAYEPEAREYPEGDAARRLNDPAATAAMESFDAYEAFAQSRYICHLPEPGEPDNAWWFGFDCAHSGDLSPGYDFSRRYSYENAYRDAEYVANECRRLARQLKAA